MSVSVFVFQIRMSVEYHERTFSFQISHKVRYIYIRRDAHQHMYMIRTCFCFMYFYSFHFAQFSQYLSHICFYLPVYNLPSILRGQILYGTYNSTSNVLNYYCQSFWPISLVFFCCGWRTASIIPQGDCLHLKIFYFTSSAGGLFSLKATKKKVPRNQGLSAGVVKLTSKDVLIVQKCNLTNHAKGVYVIRNLLRYGINTKCWM